MKYKEGEQMFNSFPICRSIFDHWIYADAEYLKIWVTMLGKARYLKETKKGLYQNVKYTLEYGEFIFGRKQWSKDLEVGEQRIRTCIKKLINDDMIQLVQSTSKFTIFSVTNYEKFNHQTNHQQDQQTQQSEEDTNHQTNRQPTTIQPPTNHHLTTNKEGKELKECKETIPYKEIIDYLNLKTNKKFSSNSVSTKDLIKARWNEKYNLEDFKTAISIKTIEWTNTEYEKFLRPQTLFSNKFEGYLNQTPIIEKPKSKSPTRREDM